MFLTQYVVGSFRLADKGEIVEEVVPIYLQLHQYLTFSHSSRSGRDTLTDKQTLYSKSAKSKIIHIHEDCTVQKDSLITIKDAKQPHTFGCSGLLRCIVFSFVWKNSIGCCHIWRIIDKKIYANWGNKLGKKGDLNILCYGGIMHEMSVLSWYQQTLQCRQRHNLIERLKDPNMFPKYSLKSTIWDTPIQTETQLALYKDWT